MPIGSGVHVPGVLEQVWQAPLHALLQQVPATQKPLEHCDPRVQTWPLT